MKRDEIEIAAQIMFLYWAVFHIPPLHPSDGQNCDIGLEIEVLWWAISRSQSEIKNRLRLLEKAVKDTPDSNIVMQEWSIGKEIKTLRWVLQKGDPPPFFFVSKSLLNRF